MKIFILFIAFSTGGTIPEGFPRSGKYYHSEAECQKAAARQKKANDNIVGTACMPVDVVL